MRSNRNQTYLRWHYWRTQHSQAMRTECVKIEGSRWGRPCAWENVCGLMVACVCNRYRIVVLRSHGCNRVACSFLKWCRAIPSLAEDAPPWREKWGSITLG